jgi:hypothetical protein
MSDSKKYILQELLATEERQGLTFDSSTQLSFIGSNNQSKDMPTIFKEYTEESEKLENEFKVKIDLEQDPSTVPDSPGTRNWSYRSVFLNSVYVFSPNKPTIVSNILALLLTFASPLIPAFGRLVHGQTFHGDKAIERWAFYIQAVNSLFMTLSVLIFYALAQGDYKRRAFLQENVCNYSEFFNTNATHE